MQSAKSCPFPYNSPLVCYLSVDRAGQVQQVGHDFQSVSGAYRRAVDGEIGLYGVWPGKYRSDAFTIDDLNAFADAFGIMRPDAHVHEVEWALSSVDDGKSAYAYVDIRLKCGCALSFSNIKKFAADMQRQKGWDVATSTGISGDGLRYTIKVRRGSLSP